MPTSSINGVIQYLRSTLVPEGPELTDAQLLECFVSRREAAPLEAIVRRHGPMVWGVCRRVLGNHHDAEDAFQATFLVLVRKAASVHPRAKVGNWLYGVAHQTALKARGTRAKRKLREAQVTDMAEPAVIENNAWRDLQPVLDLELSRLPEKYRTVIVLCDLEGKTGKDVARELSLPRGTVASRLGRARAMLAKRLARHGLTASGGTLAAVLTEKAASASVPGSVMASTIKAVTSVAAGQVATTGLVSAKVAALIEGVLKGMLLTKLKTTAALLVILTIAGLGVGHVVLQSGAAEPAKEREVNADDVDKEKQANDDTAKLQGAWRLVTSEADGVTFDEGRPEIKDTRLVIDKSSVTMTGKLIHDPRIKKKPEDVKAVGTWTLDTVKNPKQIVLTWASNPWLTNEYFVERGIYALDGDSLKLCFYFPGSDTKGLVPTEFSANAGSKRSLGTWKRVPPAAKGPSGDRRPRLDLGKIQPPGGVPLPLVKPGTTEIGVDELNKVRKRLEAVPNEDLEKWVVELERIMGTKLKDGVPSARQTCRTDFVIHMSVAFDDLKWNAEAADKLFQRAQTMPVSEANVWKEAFEALLKKKIGQTDTEILDGGPAWAVPLVLIPVDALHEGQKYSAERSKRYRVRLKQLTAEDVALWKGKVDQFGGTELDAAVNIVLLDDYFDKEKLQRDKFKAAIATWHRDRPSEKAPVNQAEEKAKLQGTWQLVSLEADGLKVGEGRPELKDTRLLIEHQSLTLFYTPETVLEESATKAKAVADFTLDGGQTPKVIVLSWKECPWNRKDDYVRKAIYVVDGERLTLCLSRKDDEKEAPTDFSANTGSERLLWNFKRVPAPEKRDEKGDAQQGQEGNEQKEHKPAAPAKEKYRPKEGVQKQADLSKIDRTIKKEPTYKSKPKYCLLVFGPQAKTRIWLVLDGDDVYVDRDANGDLAGKEKKAEKLPIPKPNKAQQVTSFMRHIPTPQGKIGVEVTQIVYDRIRNNHCVTVWLDETEKPERFQIAGDDVEFEFAERPQDAPILHFFGPRQMNLAQGPQLIRGPQGGDFYVTIGTPGLGKGSFVAHAHEGIPKGAHVVLGLEYPSKGVAGGKMHQQVTLTKRC
jgi:RNA polymerase sigma factor (sigma-70 family)